jgi:arylsulfatase A-like enzyme
MQKPNIVFICTDQQRFDSLGCSGNSLARTPNLDAIASQGVRFTNHTTPCPICSPSRASIFTGLYPRNHGLTVNGMALDQRLPTLPGQLATAGYRTHGVGKHHLQPILAPADYAMPESTEYWKSAAADTWTGPYYGFQSVEFVIGEADQATNCGGHYANWLRENHPEAVALLAPEASLDKNPSDLDEVWKSAMPAELHYNTWITDRAINFIGAVDDPFFLFVSYPDPHHPFAPPRPYCDMFAPEDMPLPRIVPGELSHMPAYYENFFSPGENGFLEAYWGSSDETEQGFLLQTQNLREESLRLAIAHTYGMVTMIDDGIGRIIGALRQRGVEDNTIVVFTSDHGELLGDHGLLHKGPPPYRQLREIPLILKGPGIPSGQVNTDLTSHIDLMPTLLDMADMGTASSEVDGQTFLPLLDGKSTGFREFVFSEYHPRSKAVQLYNQTIQSKKWRFTVYPENPEWGELFNLEQDPFEHANLFAEPDYKPIIQKLRQAMGRFFPPRLQIDNERIAKW